MSLDFSQFQAILKESPVIAILRGITVEEVPAVCDVLFECGIRILEVPLNTPNALECIKCAVQHCGERQIVGAGTVLTPQDAAAVHAAGGQIIISPNVEQETIRESVRLGMISIPGFMTPTEGFAALAAGAHCLKLFPAGSLGTGYIKNIQAVIKAPILAVGGVDAENIAQFMKVCAGAGIGGALYKPGKNLEAIRNDATAMVQALKG